MDGPRPPFMLPYRGTFIVDDMSANTRGLQSLTRAPSVTTLRPAWEPSGMRDIRTTAPHEVGRKGGGGGCHLQSETVAGVSMQQSAAQRL
jgi:hypothetical protein